MAKKFIPRSTDNIVFRNIIKKHYQNPQKFLVAVQFELHDICHIMLINTA